MKRARPQSNKAGSSKKKAQREPVTEVPSQETSSLVINSELVHAGSKEDKGPEVPLLS